MNIKIFYHFHCLQCLLKLQVSIQNCTMTFRRLEILQPGKWADIGNLKLFDYWLDTYGKVEIAEIMNSRHSLVITHFPPFWVQSSPKSNFPEEKPIFPHQNFHQNRHSLFSSIFRPTEKINRNCTIYYDKYYFCIFKMFEIREFYFTRGKFWLVNFIQKMGELVVNHSGR